MLPVPESLGALLSAFAVAFTRPTFEHVQLLVTGTLLTSGRRTVTAALRAVGLGRERHFTTYHRVLNRAVWSPIHLSRILLHLLSTAFLAPGAPLVLLIDGTLERRWGPQIALKGRYHDAVRSQAGHVVTTEGIHWVCLSLLVPSPWGGREWALPVLTVPTRSPALSQKLGKPHRTVPQYAQVLVRLVRRWYPTRELLLVGDSAFAAARLGHTCRERDVRLVSRLLLNAQLYDPVPYQPKGKPGVKPKKGPRQPKLSDRLSDETTVWQTEERMRQDSESALVDGQRGGYRSPYREACEEEGRMRCPYCEGDATQELERATALGYRMSHCRPCRRTFNERTGTPFNHLQVPTDVALLVVLWRLRYKLSLRDLAEMFLTRGFTFTHEAVREWEERFAPLLTERLRAKRQSKASSKWHSDETYVKVDGRWCYLYRAIDADGNLVDSMLSETRDLEAAKRFFARARTVVGHAPEKVTTDGHNAYPRAIREMLGPEVRHRTSRYMNNRLEQDHRGIKQRYYPMRGFGAFEAAARFCMAHDELRDYFRFRRHLTETVSLADQRRLFDDRWDEVCALMQAA